MAEMKDKKAQSEELTDAELGEVAGGKPAEPFYLTLGDVKGESVDSNHKDQIQVLSFSWDAKKQP